MKKIMLVLLLIATFSSCLTVKQNPPVISNFNSGTPVLSLFLSEMKIYSSGAGQNFQETVLPIIKSTAWEKGIKVLDNSEDDVSSLSLVFSEQSYISNFSPKYSIAATASIIKNGVVIKTAVLTRESTDTLASYSIFAMICSELFGSLVLAE